MSRLRSRSHGVSFRCHVMAALACACCLWSRDALPARAEPSLARLLAPAPLSKDPSALLVERLAEIERRPFATEAATALALSRARSELSALSAAQSAGRSAAELRRQTERVWAALSWADRLEARARTAARLKELALRAEAAEAALAHAADAYERARAERRAEVTRPDETAR